MECFSETPQNEFARAAVFRLCKCKLLQQSKLLTPIAALPPHSRHYNFIISNCFIAMIHEGEQ